MCLFVYLLYYIYSIYSISIIKFSINLYLKKELNIWNKLSNIFNKYLSKIKSI